jgi:hypothetical protein
LAVTSAPKFDVFQAGAVAQGIVGEVEDVIGLVVRQVDLEQVQAAVEGLGEAELAHQEVNGTNAPVADAPAAVADFIRDVAGSEHGLGRAAAVARVEAFLNPPLATGQLVAYRGVHSKSFRDRGDERLALLIKP